jgi:hypothetical protein
MTRQIQTLGAPVFIFFSCGEDFLRSWLGPGWLELPIEDIRKSKSEIRNSQKTLLQLSGPEFRVSIFWPHNRQSAIGNEKLVFGCVRAVRSEHYLAKSPAPEIRMPGKRLAF